MAAARLSLPLALEHDRSMHPAPPPEPARQTPLMGFLAAPASFRRRGEDHPHRGGRAVARERITVDLRGLGPRLAAYAASQGRTPTAAIRLALIHALDAGPSGDAGTATGMQAAAAATTKITLRIPAEHALLLAGRARAAEMSQGLYVCKLLEGHCPAPLPANHDDVLRALRQSTDHLAVLSADLNGFVRSVGHVPEAELQRYRASVVSVVDDVRQHLALACALVADTRAARRGRR